MLVHSFKKGAYLVVALLLSVSSAVVCTEQTQVELTAVATKQSLQPDAFKKEFEVLKNKANIFGFARVTQEDAPQLSATVRDLTTKLSMVTPPVFVFFGNKVHNAQSYVCGIDLRINALALMLVLQRCSIVVIGDRLFEGLPANQVCGILAHELSHIAHYHMIKKVLWKILVVNPIDAGVKAVANSLLPGNLCVEKKIARDYLKLAAAKVLVGSAGTAVGSYGSRWCERDADLSAARTTKDGKSLAEALYGVGDIYQEHHSVWNKINNVLESYLWWLSSHPRTKVRAEYLAAEDAKLQA